MENKFKVAKEDCMEEEISLREIFEVLKKRLWVIVTITVAAALFSGIISYFFIKPTYEASTTLMIGKPKQELDPNNPAQYQMVQTNRMLVPTYSEIVKSRSVAEQVINILNLNMKPDDFRNVINVNSVGDTELIEIKADASSPQLAVNIANTTADVFMTEVVHLMKVDNVQVLDKAIENPIPVKPKKMLNITIAAILGLMVSVFLVFLLEYMDNTIKTTEDIEKYLELPILGTIPVIKEER